MLVEKRLLGQRGESLAAAVLEQRGYTILELNYRTRMGEIDIVADMEGVIHFVEVKTRSSGSFGDPEEAVGRTKAGHIRRAAQLYLFKHGLEGREISFDVMAVEVRHITKCF